MTKNEFIEECEKLGIILNKDTLNKLAIYKELLIEWNEKFNLTSIIEEKDIYLKHFYDSLSLIKAIDLSKELSLCDFGTGAGFPGMIIAIVFNNTKVTLLESNGKKVTFLNEVRNELCLENVKIINNRVEEYAKNNKEVFDIVTCRAVSNLGIISELSISLLKINGLFVPLKSNIDEELEKYKNSIKELGYELIRVVEYKLPIEKSIRNIPVFIKNKKTDTKYPRNYNIIVKTYK